MKIFATIAGFVFFLLANVLRNHFIRHIAAGNHEITLRPKMATPKLFLYVLELHHQFAGGVLVQREVETSIGGLGSLRY